MLNQPLHKLIHFRKNTPDGITAIYINSALRTLAISLVGIFLPVFLFQQTQKIFGQGITIGFYGIIAYYFLWRLVIVVFTIPVANVVARYGFRWSVLFANILLVILLGLLSLVEKSFWIIPLAAIVHGLQTPLYWLAYRTLFAREGLLSHLGEEVSFNAIFAQLAAVAGPALGGLIITVWGFPSLFIVALAIAVFSGIPFFFMPYHKRSVPVTLKALIVWFKKKEHRNEELSFLGRHTDDYVVSLFWPIYMFMIAGTYEKQGLVASLGLIFSTAMVYVAGRIFDKKHSVSLFRFGIFGASLLWIARGLVRTFRQLVFVEIGVNSINPFYWVTFDSLTYERSRGKGENVLTFMVARQLIVSLALLLVLLVALVVAPFPWRFWGMWILAALGTLFSSFMWEKRKSSGQRQ